MKKNKQSFVKGSALKLKDLKRANIDQASKVVILTDNIDEITDGNRKPQTMEEPTDEEGGKTQGMQKELTKEEEDLLDARTIFKYKTIRKIRPDI